MEKWKEIKTVGFEGLYEVSNKGIVRSIRTGIVLKQGFDKRGYPRVYLSNKGKRKTVTVHRLVGIHFIPNPENKPQINHKDCDKTNNHVSNLEWATNKENKVHAVKNGLANSPKGEGHAMAKLTQALVDEIRVEYKTGKYSQKALSNMYGVSQSSIWRVVNGTIWR
ncbi:NUMOD4 domain-containing protein [Bacillus thuringiensis]|uniref:NUMOD4 domain-containing protein n=1 Tax=Bacillus thuringiensis TaxID=1428 RepID=UPI003F6C7E0C